MTYDKAFYEAWKPWALKLCEEWNFNADIPEIARQIYDQRIVGKRSDSKEFAVLRDVFNEYFGKDGKPPMISQFEAVQMCVEHIENNAW
jgi:hypothetical protein